ncbi:exosortase/archaeosortase family protein [Thermogutta sp.]|uniref:exosortase/archaeosortase family protein n=1 Tax=Thermogutta sp. TaxID=1962930 RepID=UPI003C7E85BC
MGATPKSIESWRPWLLGILLALLTWAYWNALSEAAISWRGEQYSHGALMPLAAAAILWLRRLGGKADWRPQMPGELRRLIVAGGLVAIGGVTYLGGKTLGETAPPSDLARGILSSGLIFLAAVFYALGLILGVVFAAKSWLHVAKEPTLPKGAPMGEGQRPSVILPVSPRGAISAASEGHDALHISKAWPGLLLLLTATGLRLAFTYFGLDVPAMATFSLSCLGAVLAVMSTRAMKWCWPAALLLLFSFPLPFGLERALLVPLQGLAASVGTYLLQTMGLEAISEGAHFIKLGDLQLGVVEQCSGLRMATAFLALVVLYLLVAEVPRWQIPVLILSAVPIALVVNIVRITLTGFLYVYAGREWGQRVFHDWAGLLMPFLAVILLVALRALLDCLIVFEEETEIPLAQRARKSVRQG